MDFVSFTRKFGSDDECVSFLEETIWGETRACPHCKSLKSWVLARGTRIPAYRCADCKKTFSITTKTALHATKLPLQKWLSAIYLMITSPKGISSLSMARWIGVSDNTSWKMGHAIREMMNQELFACNKFIGEVEFDEKYAGGKPRKKHSQKPSESSIRQNNKTAIMVIAERNGRVAAKAVKKFTKENFMAFASRFVNTAASTNSDEHAIYKTCDKHFASHGSVCHSDLQYVKGSVHNNTCESFNSMLERQYVGVHHYISKEHMQRYIDELVFKWNLKSSRDTSDFRVGKSPKIKPLEAIKTLFQSCSLKQLRRSVVGGINSATIAAEFPDSYLNSVHYCW